MPTYKFKNLITCVEYEQFMSIAEMEVYTQNPNIKLLPSMPAIVAGIDRKPDNGFRDILKNIKKESERGISRSTINTF